MGKREGLSQHQDSKTSPSLRDKISESGSSAAGVRLNQQQQGTPLPFVDRTMEMEKLRSFIDALTRDGPDLDGGLIFITGQAGIGKTRLATELSSYARGRNVRWLSAKCVRGVFELVPYSPWVELIRSFVIQAQVPLFYRVCAESVNEIIQLLPELTVDNPRSRVPVPPNLFSDPEVAEQYSRKFFQAIADFFVRLSRESPLVLVIDDMQWIDPASLRLLNYILLNSMSHSPIEVIAIFRDSDLGPESSSTHLATFVANLEEQRMFVSPERFLRLGRLGLGDVEKLVAARFPDIEKSGGAIRQALVERIYARTGGNPYFVEEVLWSLFEHRGLGLGTEQGSEAPSPSDSTIPEGIRNLVHHRLSFLDEDSIEFLEIASVVGDDFDLAMIQKVSGWGEHRVISAVEKALNANLLLKGGGSAGPSAVGGSSLRYSFADELARDILLEKIEPSRRRKYHLDIARALENQIHPAEEEEQQEQNQPEGITGGATAREATTRAAHHFLQAGDIENAIRYHILAGDSARSLFARQNAAQNYQVAVDLLRRQLMKDKDDDSGQSSRPRDATTAAEADKETKWLRLLTASTLKKLAEELEALGQTLPFIEAGLEAARIFETHGEFKTSGDLYARVGLAYQLGMFDRVNALQNLSKAAEVLSRAGESAELAYLYVCIGAIYIWDGDSLKTSEMMKMSLELGTKLEAYNVQVMALHFAGLSLPVSEKAKILEQNETALKIALEHQCYRELSLLYFDRAALWVNVKGAGPEAVELFNQGIEYTREKGYSMVNFWLMGELAFEVLLPLGEWQRAKTIAENLFEIAKSMPPTSLPSLLAASALGQVCLSLGELGRGEELLTKVKSKTKGWGVLQLLLPPYTGLVRIYMARGRYEEAEKYLMEGLEQGRRRGLVLGNFAHFIVLLSTMIELLQCKMDATRAENRKTKIELEIAISKNNNEMLSILAEIKTVADSIDEDWARAYYNRAEGIVAASQGDLTGSESSLEKSIGLWRKIGWPYELAKTLHSKGIVLERAQRLGESMNCLEDALKIFSELGAKIDIEKAADAKSRWAERARLETMVQSLLGLSSIESRQLFDYLTQEFINDHVARRIALEQCGWRTLSKASAEVGIPYFALYAKGGRSGPALKECLSSGVVEARVFKGERGRGGEITKVRIAYERNQAIKEMVNLRLDSNSLPGQRSSRLP